MSLEVYSKYATPEDADELILLLKEHNIPFVLEDNSQRKSNVIVADVFDFDVLLKARSEDFPKIKKLVAENNPLTLDEVDEKHYLFDFSDDELRDVFQKNLEWSNFDVSVAQLILEKRGVAVEREVNKTGIYKKDYIPESAPTWLIVLGYCMSGGLIGLVIGLRLWQLTKTLPDGEAVMRFDDKTRNHGMIITIIGAVLILSGYGLSVVLL